MRLRTLLALAIALSACAVHDARAEGNFDVGVWHGSPIVADGSFAFCGMLAFFGDQTTPVALTIGLDRLDGMIVAVSSDRFKLPLGRIKAGLAFDDEAPIDVVGDVRSPTLMSFKFPTTALLDRHAGARKLVLIFSDSALPFVLPRFAEAVKGLRGCLKSNIGLGTANAPPVAPVEGAPTEDARLLQMDGDPRLLADVVGPLVVGFVGSVLAVLAAAAILFAVARARMKAVYLRLWAAEYHPRLHQPRRIGLLEPVVRGARDISATA